MTEQNTGSTNTVKSTITPNIKSQLIEYQDGEQVLEGYLAYDENLSGKRPGVLVVHEWTGFKRLLQNARQPTGRIRLCCFRG
jgi:dienelactone hydrolase